MDQEAIESRARRLAHRCGVRAVKSKQPISPDNLGKFKLVDNETNQAVAGHKFDWSAEDIIDYCVDYLREFRVNVALLPPDADCKAKTAKSR